MNTRGDQRVSGELLDLLPSEGTRAVSTNTATPPEVDRLEELNLFLGDAPELDEIAAAIAEVAHGREPRFKRKSNPVGVLAVALAYIGATLVFFSAINAKFGFPLGLQGLWSPWVSDELTIWITGYAFGILGGFLIAVKRRRHVRKTS